MKKDVKSLFKRMLQSQGGIIDIGEELGVDKSTEKGSNDTEEMVNVLSLMNAANILPSEGAAFSIADVFSTAVVPTVNGSFPTVAREMEKEFARENQRLSEQVARDSEIARIHAEEELKLMIEGLDRSNKVIAKHLSEYEQAKTDLSVGEKIELINFVPMSLKEESEKVKRPRIKLDQGSSKRVKISHTSRSEPSKEQQFKGSKGVSEEELKGMMQLVPLEEVYIEALQMGAFTYDSKSNLVHDSPNIFDPPPQPPLYSCEFCGNDARYGHYCTPQILVCYNDDDDEDYAIAITLTEPDNSLSMRDEHLDTIPATESDKFIKSSIENLVLNPSESEGEHKCDVTACEDFTTFPNILFDVDYDFSSSDDQSFYDEDIPKEIYSKPLFDEEIISIKIDPHHFNAESDLIESLLNHDSLIMSFSSKIDSLLDEFAGELTLLKSIRPGNNETDCDQEFISKNANTAFESFSPFPIHIKVSDSLMEEIDLSFTLDDPMPLGIVEDDYDSEGDILILEELLSNDSLSLSENESFHFDIPLSSRPPAKPPDGNSGILNIKVMGEISKHKVPMPRLMLTLVPNQDKSSNLLSQ
nr:hypothetical protein [Tanacetum cinerariifolium]